MNSFRIELPTEEFNLPLCVSCGQVFRWRSRPDGVWEGVDGQDWYKAKPLANGWLVETNGSEAEFARLFQLDRSVREVEKAVLQRQPQLAEAVAGLPGLRLMRPSDPYEILFCFLCTPNNHLTRITQMVRHLETYGEPFPDTDLRWFPSVEVISYLSESELRSAGFGYRAKTIPAVARQLLGKPDGWLESLNQASYENAHMELLALDGIGPKVADCICLLGLHHNLAAPVDTHLWQACCREFFPEWTGKSVTGQRYKAVGDYLRSEFGELTGWAHQYLFYDNLLRSRTRRGKGKAR